jgi:hypothetical protein
MIQDRGREMILRVFARTIEDRNFKAGIVLTLAEPAKSVIFEIRLPQPLTSSEISVEIEFLVSRGGQSELLMKCSPGCDISMIAPEKQAIAEPLIFAFSWLMHCVINGTAGAVRAVMQIGADIVAHGHAGYSLAFDYEIPPEKEAEFRVEFEKLGKLP